MAGRPNRDGSTGPERSKLLVGDRSEPGELVQTAPALKSTTDNERTMSMADSSSPDYMGPGYDLTRDANGDYVLRLTSDPRRLIEQDEWESASATRAPNPAQTTPPPVQNTSPPEEQGINPYPDSFTGTPEFPGLFSTQTQHVTQGGTRAPPAVSVSAGNRTALNVGDKSAPGSEAPTVSRAKIDPVLDKINQFSDRYGTLYNEVDKLSSVAEAQLAKTQRQALQRNSIAQDQAERAALGAARGVRNRGDRALAERQAIGESSFLGTERFTADALAQAEYEGTLATQRATEEVKKIELKQSLIDDAIKNNLNVAALELDISSTNLDSATNWINKEFEQYGLNKQLSRQEASDMLEFTKAMALIQRDYDKMSSDEKMQTRQLIMDQYGIDKTYDSVMKKIEAEKDGRWFDVLTSFVGGVGEGAGSAAGKMAFTSDMRAKKNIRPADLEDLMAQLKAMNYEYKDPDADGVGPQTGVMAQDLQKSQLGADMVSKKSDGKLNVDGGKAGGVALAAIKMLYDKVAELEARL